MKRRSYFANDELFLDFFIFNDERMHPDDREWCIEEADSCGEGYFRREELQAKNDKDLANAVWEAWSLYASGM